MAGGTATSAPASATAASASCEGDAPLYRIEKRPSLRLKQGQWAVIGEGGVVLRRGRELAQVLRVFDSRRFRVVE